MKRFGNEHWSNTNPKTAKNNDKKGYRESNERWYGALSHVKEESEDDLEDEEDEEGISSDESTQYFDLDERLGVEPCSFDIWELGEIEFKLKTLPFADEISGSIKSGRYEKVLEIASQSDNEVLTVALWACWLGRSLLLAKLLQLGFNPNKADEAGRTCLHLCCLIGNDICIRLLLRHKADPNLWDSSSEYKTTPLHCAAGAKSLICVKILISAGADVNAGLSERSPLHYAVLAQAPEIVKVLLGAGACPDTQQVFTETPLHVAASLGSVSCTKLLLEAGADVRASMGPGRNTALHLAAEDGHAECARLLLQYGAQIDVTNSKQQTPLHIAALAQSLGVAELLVNKQANVKARDCDGRTPLHSSIVRGSRVCDVPRRLLSAGADPNAPDNFGYTPLHLAALNELSSCVLLLLDYGGDVTMRTNGGVSALSFIVRRVPEVVPQYMSKFDDAVHVSDHELGDVDCELTIDFRPLVPRLARGEAELLLAFIAVGYKDVLKHPVAETFLFLKWRRIRKYFVLSLIYHALFITLYSIYIIRIFLYEARTYLQPIQILIIMLNLCILTKEMFQAYINWSSYIRQWENWLQWLIILGVFLCTIPNWDNVEIRSDNWQHYIAAVTIFSCWLELMLIIGRFPKFGLYVEIFTTVTINFTMFLLAYSCLLVAYALAFSILFNYASFHVPGTLVKTIIMMAGEKKYDKIFYNDASSGSDSNYPFMGQVMFLTFVLLITVILANLLVGLAVSDIQALQESADLDRLVRQTKLVAHLESMLFSSLITRVPVQLLAVLRWGALLTVSHMRIITIRPNDPRETRIPKDLISAIYKMKMESSDENWRSSRRDSNKYELKIKSRKEEENPRQNIVRRKSNLFDRYSVENQRKRRVKTASKAERTTSLPNMYTLEEICMVDIITQLTELANKVDDHTEIMEFRLNQIENY